MGNTLRVLTAGEGDVARRAGDALRSAGLEAEVAAGEPNLEDVFVSATRGRPDREAAA